MRAIILSSLFAIGVGMAGVSTAAAAPVSGLGTALTASSVLEDVRHYRGHRSWRRPICRSVRVCRWTPYGRRCHWRRVCR